MCCDCHPCIVHVFWSFKGLSSYSEIVSAGNIVQLSCLQRIILHGHWYIMTELLYNSQLIYTLTIALRHTPTPITIRLAGSTVCSLQCVAYITGVVHYRVVGCTGETVLTICGSTRITTVDCCEWIREILLLVVLHTSVVRKIFIVGNVCAWVNAQNFSQNICNNELKTSAI